MRMCRVEFYSIIFSFFKLFLLVEAITHNEINAQSRSSSQIKLQNQPKLETTNPGINCNTTGDHETTCGTVEFLGCTGSKKFYHESAIKMNWFEAWEYCRSIGLHLASIESKYEQTFVEIFLPRLELPTTEAYWTSGTDLGKEGQFTWMATGRSFTFSFFRPGEPNNRFGSEDCIEMVVTPGVTSYSWNDRNCFAKAYVLCQQDVRYPDKLFGVSSS